MPQTAEPFWKNANILIADDEPDMRDIFAAWLRTLGCSVTEVKDGKEALEALARDKFDALVTDVRMPRVDGIELVRRLHQMGSYIPVIIFVSGFVDLPLPDAYDLGVEAVLSKPCPRKDLVGALRRSIQRRNLIFEPGESIGDPEAHTTHIRLDADRPTDTSALALGRGGASLKTERWINPGVSVRFSFGFPFDAGGEPASLAGWGVVRWCEMISEQMRAGIEFMDLDDKSREWFARWLESARPSSFIPKEKHAKLSSASP